MSRDDDELLGKGKKSADRTFDQKLDRIEKLAGLAKFVYFLLALLVAAAVWITTIRNTVNTNDGRLDKLEKERLPDRLTTAETKINEFVKLKGERDVQLKAIMDYQTANNANITALQSADLRITERLVKDEARIDKMEPLVNYMDTMRQFGMSNKEDFYTRHGYVAPGIPQAAENMTSSPYATPAPPKQHK